MTPDTGFHSVIERPDPVSRVSPPTITMATIIAATTSSHTPTALRPGGGAAASTRSIRASMLPA